MVKVTRISLCLFIFSTTIMQNSRAGLSVPGVNKLGKMMSRNSSKKQSKPVEIPAPSKPAAGIRASEITERSSPEVEYDDRPLNELEYFNGPREISEATQARLLSEVPAGDPYFDPSKRTGGYSSYYDFNTGVSELAAYQEKQDKQLQDDEGIRQLAANKKKSEDYTAQNTPPVIPTSGYNEGHLQRYTDHLFSYPGEY